ncbi:hypothetical protein GCM10022261_26010 [Brevibacterium daeguense]|uniref:DUF4352 domain-containing protein n=1 Tax=Brevibacterium daeguense TaxID=909936 RepID=A0ABP8EMA9_9MICO|nr:hypothetical protein [Brevibacterium daeguense]
MSSGNNFPPPPQGEPYGGGSGGPHGASGWQQSDQQPGGQGDVPPQPGYDPGHGGQAPFPQQGYPQPDQQQYGYQQGQPQYGSGPAPAYSTSGPSMNYAGSTPQPAPAPGYVAQQQQPKKKSKMPLILSLVAVGVVILLVVIGAVVISSVNRSQYGPDKVAEKYLEALQSGDIAAVNEIAAPTVPNGANETLLEPAYVQNSEEKITEAAVEETTVEGDTATMAASYSLGGQPYEMTLTATKDGKQGLFFDNWVLAPPTLQTIAIELPKLDGVTVNGQEFTPQEGRTEYAVLPGSYHVSTPEGKYFQAAEDQVTVGFSESEQPQPATMNVDVQPTEGFHDEVQKLVDEKLDECAKNTSIMNDGCPFNADATDPRSGMKVSEDGVEDSVSYTIDSKPKVEASMSADLAAGSFYTTEPGRYSFKADSKTAGSGAWTGSGALSPGGTVIIDGDSLSIEFF